MNLITEIRAFYARHTTTRVRIFLGVSGTLLRYITPFIVGILLGWNLDRNKDYLAKYEYRVVSTACQSKELRVTADGLQWGWASHLVFYCP